MIRAAVITDLPTIIEFQLKMAWETERVTLDKEIVTKGVHNLFNDITKGKYYGLLTGNPGQTH